MTLRRTFPITVISVVACAPLAAQTLEVPPPPPPPTYVDVAPTYEMDCIASHKKEGTVSVKVSVVKSGSRRTASVTTSNPEIFASGREIKMSAPIEATTSDAKGRRFIDSVFFEKDGRKHAIDFTFSNDLSLYRTTAMHYIPNGRLVFFDSMNCKPVGKVTA